MENMAVSVKSMIDRFRKELTGIYERKEIDSFIYLLFFDWKGWNRLDTYLNSAQLLSETEVDLFGNALTMLKDHFPVQYITGKVLFYGLQLSVTPDVLVPRPETEELVDLIIKENENKKGGGISILDIGTGSGCIAVCLKNGFPDSTVWATDRSCSALKVAMENAKRHDCPILFRHDDIFDKNSWAGFPSFDLIVSNPPYVLESEKHEMGRNVADHEPPEALFVPDDDALRYYGVIAEFALLHLSGPGLLYLEINERFGNDTRSLLLNNGFAEAEVINDIRGKHRFIRAVMNIPAGRGLSRPLAADP